jgi:hypothetical protein
MRRINLFVSIACAALLAACATPAKIGVSHESWQGMTETQHKQLKADYSKVRSWRSARNNGSADGSSLKITIVGGTAKMPPNFTDMHFRPVHIALSSGACTTANVNALRSSSSTTLSLCYTGSVLSLDPSHYIWEKRDGTLLLQKNPMWRHGLVYHGKSVNSTGYVGFKDIAISVKELSG